MGSNTYGLLQGRWESLQSMAAIPDDSTAKDIPFLQA
jgi:hypothetical protein